MIDFKKIKEYREKINELIKEKPELAELQKEIDTRLKLAGKNPQRRQQVIQEMLLNNWNKVVPIWEGVDDE